MFRPFLDLRYKGQSFYLTIPYDKKADMHERFYQAFDRRYGYTMGIGHALEVVNVRLSAVVPREEIPWPAVKNVSPSSPATQRTVLLSSGSASVPVYRREGLWRSFCAKGPILIEDDGCTLFVPSECELSVELSGCLRVTVE